MNFIIFLTSVYAFLETIVAGYIEFKDNKNIPAGILLFILSLFCLIVPNLVV